MSSKKFKTTIVRDGERAVLAIAARDAKKRKV
jgi:hypothetical protein